MPKKLIYFIISMFIIILILVVYVLSTAPTLTSITINSSLGINKTNENLTAYPIGETDADGENVNVTINWIKNGQSLAIVNMPFDNYTENSVLRTHDFSGFNNNGNISGASFTPTGGKIGGAYTFDGINDFINISNVSYHFNNSLTIEAWIKTSGTNDFSAIVDNFILSSGFQLLVDNSSHIRMDIGNGSTANSYIATSGTTNIETGAWFHVAGTFNGTIGKVYVNGVEEGHTINHTGGIAQIGENLILGYDRDVPYLYTQRFFTGTIDELRIYNISLTPEQILADYQQGNPSYRIITEQETTRGDNWTCDGIPIDSNGTNGSSVRCNSVIILNSNPILTQITINSTNGTNTTSENLTAYPNNNTDIDNDNINVTINWIKNGTSLAVLNLPMDTYTENGVTRTHDFSGYGLHSNVTNSVFNATGGIIGGAYRFVNNNSFINVSDLAINWTQYTFSAWIKIDSYTDQDYMGIFSLQRHSYPYNNGSFVLYVGNNTGSFGMSSVWSDDTPIDTRIDHPLSTGTWHYIVITYNGTAIAQYDNGALLNSVNYLNKRLNSPGNSFIIGQVVAYPNNIANLYYFNGAIDEVRIYNISLTPGQILADYQQGNPSYRTIVNNELSAGDNWTCQGIPIDSGGLNGSSINCNILNIIQNTTSSTGGGTNGLPPYTATLTIPFKFYNFTQRVQINETSYQFIVYINQSLSTDMVTFHYTINYKNYYEKTMAYDNLTSYSVNISNVKLNQSIIYYTTAKRGIVQIKTPNEEFIWDLPKPIPKIEYVPDSSPFLLVLIISIILLLIFNKKQTTRK